MVRKTQEKSRVSRVAGSFSRAARQTQARIRQAQKALIERQRLEKEARERKVNRRILLAKWGALRLIDYGKTRAMQQIIRASDRMESGIKVPFFFIEWLEIGNHFKRWVSCTFEKEGVVIEAVDSCHVMTRKFFTLMYSGGVECRNEIAGSMREKEVTSLGEFLRDIATPDTTFFARIDINGEEPTEDEVAFQFLIRQSRKETFEKDLESYLKELEGSLARRVAQTA